MLARLERAFGIIGIIGIAYILFVYCEAKAYQKQSAVIEQISQPLNKSNPSIIGRLEIPELALSVAVLSDYEPNSLREGVGHIPGTALPGGLGTVGLAGHRDTFFRPLRRLTARMELHLVDRTGTYRYGIDSTEVVTPDRVDVLSIGTRPQLTLITCYPFDYVGAAPKRFIVHAHLLSAAPDLPRSHFSEKSYAVSRAR
jgi:sortase A